jgi:predicted N-acetyltransferase YhbS
MEQVSIETLQAVDVPQAAIVSARAFATNPLTMTVLRERPDKEHYLEAAFNRLLKHMPGQVFIAKRDEKVIGLLRCIEWPHCQTSFTQTLMHLPIMLAKLRVMAIRRVRVQYIMSKHHPKKHHCHLGPVAVVPEMQGQGVGSQLLEHFCSYLDQAGEVAFLETDRLENARLYQRFGFSVTEEAFSLGVPNWFMWRPRREDVPK